MNRSKSMMMTVDLEPDWGSGDTSNLETVTPKLLDFFDDHKIRATFFVVGSLAEKHGDVIKEISRKHEIASHSLTHPNLGKLDAPGLESEVVDSKKLLDRLGAKVLGFRAPMCVMNPGLIGSLLRNGYLYDSSVSCSWFPGRYNNFFRKPEPYFHEVHKEVDNRKQILELPIPNFSAFRIPFGLPFIRLLHPVSMWRLKPKYMMYMHPTEFLKTPPGGRESFLVRKLYGRNRGGNAWRIFEDLVNRMDADFISCSDFIRLRYPGLL